MCERNLHPLARTGLRQGAERIASAAESGFMPEISITKPIDR